MRWNMHYLKALMIGDCQMLIGTDESVTELSHLIIFSQIALKIPPGLLEFMISAKMYLSYLNICSH